MLHVISLGAGVQSSTMALMFAHGELTPMPDCAIFADTGAEPKAVYDWLDWLEHQLPFPVHRVMEDSGLKKALVDSAEKNTRIAQPPLFTKSASGGQGILRRACTSEYKVKPITKKMRELCGLKPRQKSGKKVLATQYIGISYDESIRMKPSRDPWIVHKWPLVDMELRRLDCIEWMQKHYDKTPPRSACTFCPYHSDEEWKRLKGDSEEWTRVVKIDAQIRSGVRGTTDQLYLHRSLKPIDEIDFSSLEDKGQINMFGDECEGMCGV